MNVRYRTWLCAAALAIFCIVDASAQTVVPVKKESSHHLAISNEYVRVFKVEVAPKAETLYHQHDYDYVYVTIGDADLKNTRLNAAPAALKVKDGETRFAKAPLIHKVRNNLDQPFRNVTIELLRGIGNPLCGLARGEKTCGTGGGWGSGGGGVEGGHPLPPYGGGYDTLLDSQNLAVAEVSLDPGSTTPANLGSEGPLLVVPISTTKMKIGAGQSQQYEAGDPVWIPASENHLITNSSDTRIRFVVLEFKPPK